MLMSTISVHHRLPNIIYFDRDSLMTSKFWQALWTALHTTVRMITACHQQADGQSERMVKILKDISKNYVDHQQHDWGAWPSSEEKHTTVPHTRQLEAVPSRQTLHGALVSVQGPASFSFVEY